MKIKVPIFLFFLFFLIANVCIAQLKLDVGNDTAYCVTTEQTDLFRLGENMKISGGIEPYTFKWHAVYDIGLSCKFYGKDIFIDTTVQYPQFKNALLQNQWNKIYLTLSDARGDSVTDSINVWFTGFASTLGYLSYEINRAC